MARMAAAATNTMPTSVWVRLRCSAGTRLIRLTMLLHLVQSQSDGYRKPRRDRHERLPVDTACDLSYFQQWIPHAHAYTERLAEIRIQIPQEGAAPGQDKLVYVRRVVLAMEVVDRSSDLVRQLISGAAQNAVDLFYRGLVVGVEDRLVDTRKTDTLDQPIGIFGIDVPVFDQRAPEVVVREADSAREFRNLLESYHEVRHRRGDVHHAQWAMSFTPLVHERYRRTQGPHERESRCVDPRHFQSRSVGRPQKAFDHVALSRHQKHALLQDTVLIGEPRD